MMRHNYFILRLAACLLLLTGTAVRAGAQLSGYHQVLYADDIEEGKAYFIVSDRTKFAGNDTGKPKAMSMLMDSYTVSWGSQYVYWGDLDVDEEGFVWTAEKAGDDLWAFRNKANGQYIGELTGSDGDVLFSTIPVGYALTDLEDGAGRFYFISSDSPYSPHVQGFLNPNRPNNSVAKQATGFSAYVDDADTNGYPARWRIYEADTAQPEVWVTSTDDISDGDQFYIVSDRTKFAGNATGLLKAMSSCQDSYPIKWGSQYVYWGDLDKEADGFVWTATKVGTEGAFAFFNKEKQMYLGGMNTNPVETDVVFSATPVAYTLTDLSEGEGRFYMTSSDSPHSLHVQGYLRSDRPDNSLAKQNVGDDDYSSDVETYGYPGRWKLLRVGTSVQPQSEFYAAANGYYYIQSAEGSPSEPTCLADWKADAAAQQQDASLVLKTSPAGDPRCIFRIEAIDRKNGLYTLQNLVTGKYVGGTNDEGLVCMTDEPGQPLTFRSVVGNRKVLTITDADGDDLASLLVDGIAHVSPSEAEEEVYWKLVKVDNATLQSPAMQLKLALAKQADALDNPHIAPPATLSESQLTSLCTLWDKADDALSHGIFDILCQRLTRDLAAAAAGEYVEPVYDKYEKQSLRVMSYNIQHGAGNHGSLDLARTARVIKAQGADVVALQEVDSVFSSRSDNKYQVKELAELTGMYGIFCSALTGYGIGILCKELPLSVRVVSLASDFEPRRMLMAEFDSYVFASIHVGLSASARRGSGPIIKEAAEAWVETGKPVIIAGDFNDDGTDSEMQGARGALTEYLQGNGFTFHSDQTTPTWSDGTYVIDHIISYAPIGGVQKVDYQVIDDKVTSDHMPIVGNLIVGFDNGTGIGEVNALHGFSNPKQAVFDLCGRKLSASRWLDGRLPRGIYVVDGRKVIK